MLPRAPSTPTRTDREVEATEAGDTASEPAPASKPAAATAGEGEASAGSVAEDPTVEVAAMEAIAAAADSAAELDVPIDLEPEAAKRKDDPDRKAPA